MGLRDEARAAATNDGEGEVTAGLARAAAGMAAPQEPHETERLQRSVGWNRERHGVPDSAVYVPETGAMADGQVPDGRVVGRDPEPAGRELEVAAAGQVATPRRVVQGTPLHLTPEQHATLLRGINPNRIRTKQGQSHLEAWDIRRHLNRIFGFGGWSDETIELTCAREITSPPGAIQYANGGSNKREVYTVVYRAQVRLTIKNPDGSPGAIFEDAAAGDAVNQPSLGDAHDLAMKSSLSQALKRCAVNLGDQFGLSLYNKGSLDPQVNVTLVGPVVEGGNVVEQAVRSDRVHGEEAGVEGPPEDPGEASGPTGLPDAKELRNEALEAKTSLARLRQIMAMVHPNRGDHPEMGHVVVINENGDEEKLAALVYRRIEQRKREGEQ